MTQEEKANAMTRLEKQYEKPQGKSVLEAIREEKVDSQNCVKTVDKVEPNFNVGDWIIRNNKYTGIPVKVIEFNGYYSCELNGEVVNLTRNDVHNNFHLWTIQDAKDGDVLAFDNDTIVIFKDLYNSTSFHSYCHIEDGIFDFNKDELPDWWNGEGFKPATKEQSDILFQKIKEAGYEWDADKTELRKWEIK